MVSYYGRKVNSDTDSGITGVSTSNQRFSVFGAMPEHGWGHTMYLLAGKLGGTSPTFRMAISTVDSNDNPNDRMAYTSTVTATAVATGGGDATVFSAPLVNVDTPTYGVTNAGVMMKSGKHYGLGFAATLNQLLHGMIQAANPNNNYGNNLLYLKDVGSVTPADPIAYTSSSFEGVMSIAIAYDPNVAPDKPTGLTPAGTITTLTPTMLSAFSDGNENRGDKLKQYKIQLRAVGSATNKWAPSAFDASSSEQTADQTSTVYAGTALVAGTPYEWRIQHSDQFDAWSAWSNWTAFTVNAGGTVATPTAPTGKQLTLTPGPFTAGWSHGSALSTNAVEVRLLQGGSVVKTMNAPLASVVANGGTISISWAQSTFSAIAPGQTYQFQIRGRDSGNLWSDWSAVQTFNTNAAPNDPTPIYPLTTSQPVTAFPKITVKTVDPDNAMPGGGVVVSLRIKSNAGVLLFTRTMTLRAGTVDTYDYQTTGTDLASFATYKYDASATDGTLTSGFSPEQTFIYGSGPVVTVTAPTAAQVLTTNTPNIVWTATGQVKYQVWIYLQGTSTIVWDSGQITSAVQSITVPSGYLHNAVAYDVVVGVTNATPLTGYNSPQPFSLSYPAPVQTSNFVASPFAVAGDTKASAILLSWDAPPEPPSAFDSWIIKRRDQGTGSGDGSEITLRRLTSVNQLAFVDYLPASGKAYTYGLSRAVYQGTDLTQTDESLSDAMVQFDNVILSSASQGGDFRVSLRFVKATKVGHKDDISYFMAWGDEEPVAQMGVADFDVISATYQVITDRFGLAEAIMEDIRDLKDHQMGGNATCYRDNRGRKVLGVFSFEESDDSMLRYLVDVTFTETNATEGEP